MVGLGLGLGVRARGRVGVRVGLGLDTTIEGLLIYKGIDLDQVEEIIDFDVEGSDKSSENSDNEV